MVSGNYRIEARDKELSFSTASFRAEKGSILHSGIYNREMASSLAAGACVMLSGFFFVARHKVTPSLFLFGLVLFAILFLLFRTYVFRDTVLYVVIDKAEGIIEMGSENIFGRRGVTYPLTELENIRQDYFSFAPENPDGVRVVEKIALQHGTVIPGFGKTAEFHTVELEFKGGSRQMIYSAKHPSSANEVAMNLNNFMRGNDA